MPSRLILVLLLAFIVDSLPIGNRQQRSATRSANDPAIVTMPESIWNMMIENDETKSVGLYAVYGNATYLTNEDLYKPEVCS